jgi:IclR family mhp operon transcriptional activator
MPRALETRSLDRGIQVVEALARHGPCPLFRLHQLTGLPKSTLRRLLATLVQRHFVRTGIEDDRYRVNISLPWASGVALPTVSARLVEAALPHMALLTHKIEWPSDLLAFRRDRMVIVESTRPLSPFSLYQALIDFEVNMFATAGGLAYLSTLDDRKVARLMHDLSGDERWGATRFGLTEQALAAELAQIRRQGYATRRSGYTGETISDDQLHAIAVPVREEGTAIGALTICWLRTYMPPERFARRHLDRLQATAQAITQDLRQPKRSVRQ